jgi:membrane protein DedA with SNARE-associated domain
MLRRVTLVLFCALLVPIVPFLVIGELPRERFLLAHDPQSWTFGAVGALLLALDVLLPIPSSVVGSLLGARLGLGFGFVFTWLGLCVGHALGYALGRLLPARFATELPQAPSAIVVFLTRPVPVFAEAVAIAAGVTRFPAATYAASAALGNACYALVLAGNGAWLLPSGLAGPGAILPMLLPVAAYVLWRKLARA